MDRATERFLDHVKTECRNHGVRLYLSRATRVHSGSGIYCSGWFNGEVLSVAAGGPIENWLPILVHEFGHFGQWVDKDPTWTKTTIGGYDANEWLDEWLTGKTEMDPDTLQKVINKIVSNELNCERRAVKMIRKYKLPININSYIRGANAYIYFYHVCKEMRKWYNKDRVPYQMPEVLRVMPTHLAGDHLRIKPEIFLAIRRACFEYPHLA